jgi:hypothetical protein
MQSLFAVVFGIMIASLLALLYFFPFVVACMRKHKNSEAIFILNLFLGWTGFGWVIALVWSATN